MIKSVARIGGNASMESGFGASCAPFPVRYGPLRGRDPNPDWTDGPRNPLSFVIIATSRSCVRGLRRWIGVVGLALAASAMPVSAAEELAFTSKNVHQLLPFTAVYPNQTVPNLKRNDVVPTPRFFGLLQVTEEDAGEATLEVADAPDLGSYQFCLWGQEGHCPDLALRVTNGLLHATGDFTDVTWNRGLKWSGRGQLLVPTNDFPDHRLEVSATLPSGLQVHQDILVRRPESTPECGDYPDADADRFLCLSGAELLPDHAERAELVDDLPDKLVQPKANYKLVFAEEFDGDVDGDGADPMCEHGFPKIDETVLDTRLWSFPTDNCDTRGSNNQPMVTVRDGHYEMAATKDFGSGGLNSHGKFAFKYGYVEIKYTIDILPKPDGWQNTAIILGDIRRGIWNAHSKYGIEADSYEKLSKFAPHEVDLVEFITTTPRDVWHQYINWYPFVFHENIVPVRSTKSLRFCGNQTGSIRIDLPNNGCRTDGVVTITKGYEWTPRGYRNFYRVHGLHDEMQVVHRKWISVQIRPFSFNEGEPVTVGNAQTVTGTARDAYFELLDADDEDTLLEQVAIGHLPYSLDLIAWGYPRNSEVRSALKLDYIRVFQPVDRYADMEPVYQ